MKKLALVGGVLIIAVSFIAFKYANANKTIEEVLHVPKNTAIINVIEESKDGIIVFSRDEEGDGLYTNVIDKTLFGYENLYSGASNTSGIESRKDFGFTHHYWGAIKNTPLPIYTGVVTNDEITSIKVKETNKEEWKEAEIFEVGDIRVWLVYMKGFEGSDFDIVGFGEDGEEITSKSEDISPSRADDKPIRSPYK